MNLFSLLIGTIIGGLIGHLWGSGMRVCAGLEAPWRTSFGTKIVYGLPRIPKWLFSWGKYPGGRNAVGKSCWLCVGCVYVEVYRRLHD